MELKSHKTLQKDEQGLMSFVVVLIIMIILSLLVIGFANLSRREQEQSLDRQLQTQAFYAAESGINDAIKILKANPAAKRDSCGDTASPWDGLPTPDLSGDGNIEYTCVLVKPFVPDIKVQGVNTEESKVIPINMVDADGNPLSGADATNNTITIKWKNPTAGSVDVVDCDGGGSDYPPAGSWACSVGMLRVDLVSTGASFDRDSLLDNYMTLYLYPGPSANPVPTGAFSGTGDLGLNQGTKLEASCEDDPAESEYGTCTATITDIDGLNYMMRLRSIYRSSDITISADPIQDFYFAGAQAIIDATGRANDVLRRVQARYSIGTADGDINYTIESNDICKRYHAIPGVSVTDPDGCGI